MAGWMDSLMAAGWMPVASGAPVQFDEYGNPVPTDPVPVKSPFPEIKKKTAIAQMAPQAGIVEPGLGQMGPLGLLPEGGRTPDPLMPGNDYPAIPTPEIRRLQSLATPGYEQTAERVPMPRERPAAADAPPQVPTREADGAVSNAATDMSSSNRGSVRPQEPADPTSPASPAPAQDNSGPSIFGRIGNFLQGNSNTLLALGAGLAGAPNIGQGISRAAAAAIPASQADIKNRTTLQSQSSTFRALIEAGVPANQALGAIGNPDLQKALIKSYIEDRGLDIKMVKQKNAWGEEKEVPYIVNKFPKDGEPAMRPAFAAPGAAPGTPGVAPASPTANPTGGNVYAPGINDDNFNHGAVGEDYIRQFSPAMQDMIKNYLSTGTIPSGRQAQTSMIKQAATKYGADIGMPADDATLVQRKEWARSLGDTKSGVGLQAKGFQQGLEHFVKLSDNLVKMNLSNGLGFEPAAGWANWVKSLSTDQQELIHKSDVQGQALAREMGNLFSKNGGGVHEAAETKKNISNAFMSSKAAAGSLAAVDELMQGGLGALTNRRDELFPNGNAPRGSEFLGPKQQEQLEHIRRNIAILKGEAAAPASSAAPRTPAPGRYRFDPASGTMTPIQ